MTTETDVSTSTVKKLGGSFTLTNTSITLNRMAMVP